jgi:uncharacterized protein (DUF608 family)
MSTDPAGQRPECPISCGCGSPNRRQFLKITGLAATGLGAAGLLADSTTAMAGPFTVADFDQLVPADKKLSPQWVKGLTQRGTPTVYRGEELKYIGMPVGGICAGQLYLGGDGRLWHWDIFNQEIRTGGGNYAHPPAAESPVKQGFALRMADGQLRPLDVTGFPGVTFRGEYPIGTVEYRDDACPLAVKLEAFSPFIPLNAEDSSLPATVMHFTLRNTSAAPVEATLVGSLENAVLLHHREAGGARVNRRVAAAGYTFLEFSAEKPTHPQPVRPDVLFEDWNKTYDNGTMGLALLGAPAEHASADASAPLADTLAGELGRAVKLAAGESAEVTFVVAWHFPNLVLRGISDGVGRHYASRFPSASAVVDYVVKNFERLDRETRLWRSTWYDSSLPFWFLDRTLLNASILASSTCHWFADGRFYGWEGVGCCAGTCTHVWHYAHSAARLFPELERILRERVDFGLALLDDGAIRFRGEANTGPAADGQAGSILRAYREHQMSADDAFLKRNWAGVKKALEYLIHQDGDGDGILAGSQHNTLDANWFGPVAWLSGLYLAALRAGEEMAREVGDEAFARQCQTIFAVGTKKIVELLFDGEYFINRPDPAHPEAINSGSGCEIDQVMGQSWAFQVGLGRVLPQRESLSALRSLWRYNFTPDAGPFRAKCKPGRWFAMAGEAGLLMCTFPRRDWDFVKAAGRGNPGFAGYFNECMNGFEHQVAGHMIWEGMLQEGLAIERALDDRYHASRRNPWNEVECGDHYARSMASHGVFLAACGYEYHGPKGHLSFVPRLGAEDFKAAFTAAEGWGSIQQRRTAEEQANTVTVAWGKVRLTQLTIEVPPGLAEGAVQVTPPRAATPLERDGSRIVVRFQPEILVTPEQPLVVKVTKRA